MQQQLYERRLFPTAFLLRGDVLGILWAARIGADGVITQALPTRDAVLPIRSVLTAARLARQTQLFGGFAGAATTLDLTDGIRAASESGAVIHLLPSGNAPELRCYTEADSEAAAILLNNQALAAIKGVFGL